MPDAASFSGLSNHGLAMLLFTAVVFAVFVWDRFPISTVCLAILVALPLLFLVFPYETDAGPLEPYSLFYGFAHPALLAICALMILGHALVLTGALEPAARKLSSLVARRPGLALVAVLLGAALASGFVNDTPVVVLLIPLLIAATRRAKASPAAILMPMNYAVLIGGMATTIGTSTNLIVVSMAQQLGLPPFGMLSFYPLVAAAAVPALLYLWLVAPRLLRSVEPQTEAYSEQVFDADLRVEPDSWLEGKELREVLAATDGRMRVLEVRTAKGFSRPKLPTMRLVAGDRLLVQDTVENLKEFETVLKTALHDVEIDEESDRQAKGQPGEPPARGGAGKAADRKGEQVQATDADRRAREEEGEEESKRPKHDEAHPDVIVAQFVVAPESPIEGRTVRQHRLAERYKLVVVGLRPVRAGRGWARKEIVDRVLGAGDILLVQGSEDQLLAAQNDGIGLLLDSRHVVPRQEKSAIALATMAGVVLLAATKTLPIGLAALAGVLVLLGTRSISWQDVGNSLSTKVIMLVAASLALGSALSVTGGTAFLARELVGLAGAIEPRYLLALLMLLMGLFTNFVSNNAAAAIGTPLGIEMARALGVPPEPYVLAVLFGCNLCYLTPMGYQTNLLVMNAAGYRFSDFVKVGTPLFFIMWAALCAALVLSYGL
jgi:di/tricarboxylate transporter